MKQATSKIILGTVQFGLDYGINNSSGKPSTKEVARILDCAYDNGIHILDTAEAYGNAQEVIGDYHGLSTNRFEVITKFSPIQNDIIGNLTQQVERNLRTMNIDTLYGYMFHSFRDFEFYFVQNKEELAALKNEGKVRKFGVSVYLNSEIEALLTCDAVDIIQLPFNLLDNVSQRSDLIAKANANGIEVHTRSAFLQGLFFLDIEKLPSKLQPILPYIERLNKISKRTGYSIADLALNYVVQQKGISYAVIGVDTSRQLNVNLKSLQNRLSGEILEEISSIIVKETELLNPSNWNS